MNHFVETWIRDNENCLHFNCINLTNHSNNFRWLLPETTPDEEVEDNFGNGLCAPTQRQLWNLFENPHHSKAAKVFPEWMKGSDSKQVSII